MDKIVLMNYIALASEIATMNEIPCSIRWRDNAHSSVHIKTIPSSVARISSLQWMKDLIFENASSMGFNSGE